MDPGRLEVAMDSIRIAPWLAVLQDFLRENGAVAALMSGSGSTTFGIFASEAAASLAWRCVACGRLRLYDQAVPRPAACASIWQCASAPARPP